ncbi:uncharacterized protein EAE98_011461 [Botrytis deweyae]|uniref:2EXR domain-containing protein n=1 Tax=Botrytis deweyae TaxID=2478750 RepID=A0ABQ7I5U9_9HELO|nr:uncharacterized protein EAE98_011461 [Botrytis deweyae]KAF7914762.1 hypothetical protein EAE98_011461 [Botrytis deweyae]
MNSQDQSSDQALAQDQSNDQAPVQSSDIQTPVDFTLFPQIPLDIRVMIWKLTLTPRLLNRRILSVNSDQPLTSINIPSLLGVNAETRYESLKCYQNIAISAERLQDLRLLGDYWVPKGEKLRILFNSEIDTIVDEYLRCDTYVPSRDTNLLWRPECPLLINPDFVKKVQVSPDVFMNSFSHVMRASPFLHFYYHSFEDIRFRRYDPNRTIFTNLLYNNLNEFIVQDFDCVRPHKFDSPNRRAMWKNVLKIMFKAETTRTLKAHIQVSIPKIRIRPGAKVGLCDRCTVRFTPWTEWPLEIIRLPRMVSRRTRN